MGRRLPAKYAPRVDDGARDAFARHGLMRLLGAELVELADGRCVIELAHRDELTQHHGYFHAGAIGAVLDTAGGFDRGLEQPKC